MVINKVPKAYVPAATGWLGGKTKLSPTIIACMPPHECYVECFAGSAVVFFNKHPKTSRIEIINDIHSELVNLMKVLSGTYFDEKIRKEFIGYVRNMPAAREVYEDWKSWDKGRIASLSPAQRAFRFYYCVKKGFSSIPKGGYEASPLSSSRYNMNTDFEKFAARFRASNAQIEHLDFRVLIDKYNRKAAKTFIFSDPPYWVAQSTSYYEFIFEEKDHQDLKKKCDEITENDNTFLVTYDDVEEIISLYQDYFIYRTDDIVYNAADERGKRDLVKTELFITNYDIAQVVCQRNKQNSRADIFENIEVDDRRIEVPGHIGLTRIH